MATRSRVRLRSELSAFEIALCQVVAEEVAIDGRSAECIASRAGFSPSSLRLMCAGKICVRIVNLQQLARTLGMPMWAMVKAAESRAALVKEQQQCKG